jgi:hypothetical protein
VVIRNCSRWLRYITPFIVQLHTNGVHVCIWLYMHHHAYIYAMHVREDILGPEFLPILVDYMHVMYDVYFLSCDVLI